MSQTFNELVIKAIKKYHLEPAPCDQPDSCCGRCYQIPEDVGSGRVWVYEDGPYRGMVLMDMVFQRDFSIPNSFDYSYLSYYESITGLLSYGSENQMLEPWTIYTNCKPYESVSMCFKAYQKIKGLRLLYEPKKGLDDIAGGALAGKDLGRLMGIRHIPQVTDIIAQIETCPIKNEEAMSRLYYHSKVQELLSLYVGSLERERRLPGGVRTEDGDRIYMITDYIRNHLEENTKLEELARMAQMSTSKLKYIFKTVTGKTVGEYRDDLRMRTAYDLLPRKEIPIATIGRQLGFTTASSFSRFFRQHTGMSPADYRVGRT